MIYRRAELRDIDKITEIELASMSMPWSRNSFVEALESEHTIFIVAELDGNLAGYAVLYLMTPEAELPDIVVDCKYRGQGVGRALLNELITLAKAESITDIFLEVRTMNSVARNLYKAFGFEETGIRKKFYRDPEDDAVCMHLSV